MAAAAVGVVGVVSVVGVVGAVAAPVAEGNPPQASVRLTHTSSHQPCHRAGLARYGLIPQVHRRHGMIPRVFFRTPGHTPRLRDRRVV